MDWSGGAMVLGKLPVLGSPTNLDNNEARAYCTCNRCGWGCFDIFFLSFFSLFLSPSLGDCPAQTEILSQKAIKPKTTNQPMRVGRRQKSHRQSQKEAVDFTQQSLHEARDC